MGPVTFVEAVDPATGTLLARGTADAVGNYSLVFARPTSAEGLVVQATTVVGSQVTAFLAAPLPVQASSSADKVDVTTGTTTVVFSQALLSGVTSQFTVTTGFRGLKAPEMTTLIALDEQTSVFSAAGVLDGSQEVMGAKTGDNLMSAAISGAEALTTQAATLAFNAGGQASDLVAAVNVILTQVAQTAPQGSPVETSQKGSPVDISQIIASAANQVTTSQVQQESTSVVSNAVEAGQQAVVSQPVSASPNGSLGLTVS